jgi:hypothetical protein
MRKILAVTISILFLVTGCSDGSKKSSPTASPPIKIDNLKSCKMWQQAAIEFLESENDAVSVFWAQGIKLKNSAETADAKLKEALFLVGEKFLSVEEGDTDWNTTPAYDAARDYVISTCESLGVFVK